jgi:hypothetical protein
VGKKLRSLRHSFGRREHQEQLQKETATWSSHPILPEWEGDREEPEGQLVRSGSDIQRSKRSQSAWES